MLYEICDCTVFILAHLPIFLNVLLSTLVGRFALKSTKKACLELAARTDSNQSWDIRIFFSWDVRSSVRLYVHT